MGTARDLVERKGDTIASLLPEATVREAAHLMNDWQIGSVLVMQDRRLLGIFTERDILRRVVAAGRDPETTPLQEVMTTPVACAAPHSLLDELRLTMRRKRIRHIPVVQDEQVIGMISLGDLNHAEHEVQELTIKYLTQYMSVM